MRKAVLPLCNSLHLLYYRPLTGLGLHSLAMAYWVYLLLLFVFQPAYDWQRIPIGTDRLLRKRSIWLESQSILSWTGTGVWILGEHWRECAETLART